MRKKKLLSETQVRRFMGLAGIKPLNEMYHDKDKNSMMEEEEDLAPEPMDMEDDAPDMDVEDEAGAADIDIDEEKVKDFVAAAREISDMADMLSGVTGGDMEDDLGDETADLAPMPDEDEDMDMEDDDDMDKMDEELMEVDMELTEDEIVNEVARRVSKRIVEAKRAHKKMNEALGRKTTRRRRR